MFSRSKPTPAESQNAVEIRQPPQLFEKTQALLRTLQQKLQAPVLCYWNSWRGSICGNDIFGLYEILEHIGQVDTVYFFIKSSGGNGKESLRMIHLIRRHCKRLVALVPLECASAATMLAIGADEIQMGSMAYLSAVDTSLTHDLSPIDRDNDRVSVSLDELNRVVNLWKSNTEDADSNPYKALFEYVHPLVIGAVDRAESLSIMLCEQLLSYHIADKEKVRKIAENLNSKYPSHGYPILIQEAERIGLNVRHLDNDINELLLSLNTLYSEMGQKAVTDFSDTHSHSNEILNIMEAEAAQVFYQNDKDWFYRSEERRWITLNDNSHWHITEVEDGKIHKNILHIA